MRVPRPRRRLSLTCDSITGYVHGSFDDRLFRQRDAEAQKQIRLARVRSFVARQESIRNASESRSGHQDEDQPVPARSRNRNARRLQRIAEANDRADVLAFQFYDPTGMRPMVLPSLPMDIHTELGRLQRFRTVSPIQPERPELPATPKADRFRKVNMDLDADDASESGSQLTPLRILRPQKTITNKNSGRDHMSRHRNGMMMEDLQVSNIANASRQVISVDLSAPADENVPEPPDEMIEAILDGPYEEHFVFEKAAPAPHRPHRSGDPNDPFTQAFAEIDRDVQNHRYRVYVQNMAKEGVVVNPQPQNQADLDASDAWHERISREAFERANRRHHIELVHMRFPKYYAKLKAKREMEIDQEEFEKRRTDFEKRWDQYNREREAEEDIARQEDEANEVEQMLREESTVDQQWRRLGPFEARKWHIIARVETYSSFFGFFPSRVHMADSDVEEKLTFATIPWPTLDEPKEGADIDYRNVRSFVEASFYFFDNPLQRCNTFEEARRELATSTARVCATEFRKWDPDLIEEFLIPYVDEGEQDVIRSTARSIYDALFAAISEIRGEYPDLAAQEIAGAAAAAAEEEVAEEESEEEDAADSEGEATEVE